MAQVPLIWDDDGSVGVLGLAARTWLGWGWFHAAGFSTIDSNRMVPVALLPTRERNGRSITTESGPEAVTVSAITVFKASEGPFGRNRP